MDFVEFKSKFGNEKELAPLSFHLVDVPFVVQEYHCHSRKFSVIALAWTKRDDALKKESKLYTYALALERSSGRFNLVVIRQENCWLPEGPWKTSTDWFYKKWVQDWLINHPNDLVNGAINGSRVDWEACLTCEFYTSIASSLAYPYQE